MTYYYYYYGHLRPLVEVGYLDRHQVELLAARLDRHLLGRDQVGREPKLVS